MKSKGKQGMKVESIRTLNGPNVYSYRPVLLMRLRLDLGELVERESREFNDFNERLLTLLPGIKNHHCSFGRPGGFMKRLEEGTYFGHVVEHVALELTELAGIGKSHGKTRHDSGSVYVVIEFRAEKATTYLFQQAVKLVEKLIRKCEVILDEVEALRKAITRMAKGEVIVLFYEKLRLVQKELLELAAQPVAALPRVPAAPASASASRATTRIDIRA
jgi:ribosomal protein S6